MKRIATVVICLSISASATAALMSPNVNLPDGGEALPTKTINVGLSGLVPKAAYNIVCYLTASQPFEVVMLGSDFGKGTGEITSYNLNGVSLQQGQLDPGTNKAVIVGHFEDPTTAKVTFTNLDQANSFIVDNCFAYPLVG